MKPTERVLDVDSTLAGENVRMGIDQSALQHIIGVLTDLYSDPELAVIREYSTNALDAHRDAGNPLPIEVTLPTPLAPFFRVRDYGDGLDAEDIRSIYSQYGTSTKRDSDDVVGMLGLGCKSALTYTDQFTLVGTKNGRTVQVSIHRDEDGGGSMTIVSDEATPDAPSGVEVIVPAARQNGFERKARDFFRFWTKGSVLVNGAEPEHITAQVDPTWLVPDKLLVYDANKGGSYNAYSDTSSPGWVVMGNVAYPMPEQSNMRAKRYRIVAFVDIGEVNFTPSREALMLTKRTKETLERIHEDVRRELASAMQKRVTAAASPSEAIRLVQEANVYGVKTADLTYQGKTIPDSLDRSTMGAWDLSNTFLVVNFSGRYSKKSGDRVRSIPPYGSGRMVFTGFEAQAFSTAKREKFDAWLEQEGIDRPTQVICVKSLSADEAYWLKGVPTYDWSPVQAIKVTKAGTVGPSGRARPRGSYEVAGSYSKHIEAGDIDCSKTLLYIRPDERHDRRSWSRFEDDANTYLLIVPANRVEKFKRDFAHAMHWREYVRQEAQDWLDQQDTTALEAAKYRISGQGLLLTGLDPAEVNDAELAKAIRLQNTPGIDPLIRGIETRRGWLTGFDKYDLSSKYPDPLKDYPLVANGYALSIKKHASHFYLYVNAAHAARQKESN